MDTPDLAELVPGLMARHPAHDWTVLSGRVEGEDLRVEISPSAAPDRVATVVVHSGAEIFGCMFAGHESNDFAYEDVDRPEVLGQRIDLAAEATLGPTRVVLHRAGDVIVGSTMVLDAEGPNQHEDTVLSWPLRRIKAHLSGHRILKQVLDFPSVGQPPDH